MLGRRQTIFLTPYFHEFKIFDFFLYVCDGVNCHGKVMEFYYQIYVGTLMMKTSVPMTLLSLCCRNRIRSCGRAPTVMIAFSSG